MSVNTGKFSGYASVFGIPDRQNDIVLKGAFNRTIKNRAGDIKVLWQHDFLQPIGFLTSLKEDSHGLLVEGELLLDIQKGKEAHALLKAGAVGGLSIGFTTIDSSYEAKTGMRFVHDVDLWEVSIVTFPANAEAKVNKVKNQSPQNIENDSNWISAKRNGDSIRLLTAINDAINAIR